ncbi:MAG TPA: TIGR03067 domain-containing protein [Gemmataceae bacterium]
MRTPIVLALGLAVTAGLRGQDGAKELEKLKGTWVIVKAERGGKPTDEPKGDKITFDGEKIAVTENQRPQTGRVKIDPTKTPKKIDLTPDENGEGTVFGIYELSGDTLKICIGRRERPKAFATKEGATDFLLFFEREKKK